MGPKAQYQLTINAPPGPISGDGPIWLALEVTYFGATEVTLAAGDLLDVEFQLPRGWRLDPTANIHHLLGPVPTVTLAAGQSFTHRIDLRKRFTRLPPGRATLRVTVRLWPQGGAAEDAIVLHGECTLDLLPGQVGR